MSICAHPRLSFWEATDWRQIVVLYDMLLQLMPSPVVRLNRAVALWQVEAAQAALAEVDSLAQELDNYHLFHAVRGELLMELSRGEQARAEALRAMELTHNRAEQSLLARRALEW